MKQVNDELIKYIIDNIISQYSDFDKAHNIDHVNDVIKNSMDIAEKYDVNANMVYTIAAYHDIGIRFGREKHNITSAKILSDDDRLKKWFCDEQIEVMKKAIEDHRASNDYEPRSIYGKIVSEADRCMNPEKIICRTKEFGKAHYPELTNEQQFERAYNHIADKYGEN